ncbi:hypothetical protein PPYR_00280 [Photinus pyralis]|uniref:Uncharacterized protein n=1 Tax=Photinus pyralis TaxID=7054 RepID=A0A5N4B1P4_PHOPY|nr:hypothetical protein PPYR_00280 [Photinus pyralis]
MFRKRLILKTIKMKNIHLKNYVFIKRVSLRLDLFNLSLKTHNRLVSIQKKITSCSSCGSADHGEPSFHGYRAQQLFPTDIAIFVAWKLSVRTFCGRKNKNCWHRSEPVQPAYDCYVIDLLHMRNFEG